MATLQRRSSDGCKVFRRDRCLTPRWGIRSRESLVTSRCEIQAGRRKVPRPLRSRELSQRPPTWPPSCRGQGWSIPISAGEKHCTYSDVVWCCLNSRGHGWAPAECRCARLTDLMQVFEPMRCDPLMGVSRGCRGTGRTFAASRASSMSTFHLGWHVATTTARQKSRVCSLKHLSLRHPGLPPRRWALAWSLPQSFQSLERRSLMPSGTTSQDPHQHQKSPLPLLHGNHLTVAAGKAMLWQAHQQQAHLGMTKRRAWQLRH